MYIAAGTSLDSGGPGGVANRPPLAFRVVCEAVSVVSASHVCIVGEEHAVRENNCWGRFIGPPYQCGEHWSGGPSSLVRGAKEKLSIPPIGCLQDSVCKILYARFCTQDSVSKIRRPGRSDRVHPNLPDFSKTVNKPLIRVKGSNPVSEIDRVNLRNLEESRKPRFF